MSGKKEKVLKLFRQNLSDYEISKQVGLSERAVANIIHKFIYVRPKPKKEFKPKYEQIKELAAAGKTHREIMVEVGCCREYIYRLIGKDINKPRKSRVSRLNIIISLFKKEPALTDEEINKKTGIRLSYVKRVLQYIRVYAAAR